MCGITGFFTDKYDRSVMQAVLGQMTESLHHRGPDSGDTWQDPDVGCALGHRRLSIIDVSADGAQPMVSATGRYVVTYNGEIYNFQDLRASLPDYPFKGHSDTEVFLACVETYGVSGALEKINGMFALALWDRRDRVLHLARDRMGKKPLYVGYADGDLIFSSELKAFRHYPNFKPQINQQALALYLQYGYVPAPYCVYEGVHALLPGHMISVPFGTKIDLIGMMVPHWDQAEVLRQARRNMSAQKDATVIDEFSDLLTRCVKDRMVSDVPLGAFLSGGIDSSVVTALMQLSSEKPVKTYTIGFAEDGFDEAVYAKNIAHHLGTDHHELYVSEHDALNVIPDLPHIYDEPFADISAIPTYLVSWFARSDVTVALSGDGGDEMLGGYNRHIRGPALWSRMRYIPGAARRGIAGLIRQKTPSQWDRILSRQPQAGISMHKLAKALSMNSREELFTGFLQQWDNPPLYQGASNSLEHKAITFAPALSFAENMMAHDARFYLPHNILTKVDRASMAVSLEARAPLLDYRIYEYVWSLPLHFKIRDGQGKWLLRQVLARHVPSNLFERPKQGFSMPVGAWLRGALRDWAEHFLDEQAMTQQGLLDVQTIRAVWQDHINGTADHGTKLWTVLMFQAWRDKWL